MEGILYIPSFRYPSQVFLAFQMSEGFEGFIAIGIDFLIPFTL